MKHTECGTAKISTRITKADYHALKNIAREGGFRSVYTLIRYIILVFLRACASDYECVDLPLQPEFVELFNWKQRRSEVLMALSVVNRYHREHGMKRKNTQSDDDQSEIDRMFASCMSEGASLEFNDNIRKRK